MKRPLRAFIHIISFNPLSIFRSFKNAKNIKKLMVLKLSVFILLNLTSAFVQLVNLLIRGKKLDAVK